MIVIFLNLDNRVNFKKMSNMKLKICVFVDTDIAVRHFIKTNAFKDIDYNHDVTYIFLKIIFYSYATYTSQNL